MQNSPMLGQRFASVTGVGIIMVGRSIVKFGWEEAILATLLQLPQPGGTARRR